MITAITRQVSPAMARCELSHVARTPIDLLLAAQQHRDYQQSLRDAGCEVIELAAEADLPDSVFVEDVAVVLDEVAVITRPGAASRRAEVKSVAAVLERHRALTHINEPGTLDGGDVLRLGREVLIGVSGRSNAAGIEQMRGLLAPHAYRVRGLPIRDCLHLKSAVTEVADGLLLLQPQWIDKALFPDHALIEVDPSEAHAANALRVGDQLIYPSCFPRTLERLHAAGIAPILVDVSELQKAEGAVTCCSLLLR